MFFTFHQTNSGGSRTLDKDTAHNVIIEADSYTDANDRAEAHGLYFDGIDQGLDCGCCGERWTRMYDFEEGDKVPSRYGTPLGKPDEDGKHFHPFWPYALVVYKDGTRRYWFEGHVYDHYREAFAKGR